MCYTIFLCKDVEGTVCSPWIRGAPQVGLSATMWKINSRISGATGRQFPAGREIAPPSTEAITDAQPPRTAYRVVPVLAWDVCVSRRQAVVGERGFLASGCGGYKRWKVQTRTRAERDRT